nr:sulfur transferase domain-containing protein [Aurantiacibacter rhizosphaerae]
MRLSDRVTTSGALGSDDPARLAAIGTQRVIYLAMADHPEAVPDAAAAMASAGMAYAHIPVPWDAPEESHYIAFRQALESQDSPVHVHCIMNWRVAAFMYRWHQEQGMPEPEARAIMERVWSPTTSEEPHADKWARFIGLVPAETQQRRGET